VLSSSDIQIGSRSRSRCLCTAEALEREPLVTVDVKAPAKRSLKPIAFEVFAYRVLRLFYSFPHGNLRSSIERMPNSSWSYFAGLSLRCGAKFG